ncbi:MAG: choice-of-anchor D domain-containing protein, partial [Pseudomonadota bacterium]|nr:choice-of-anchor D domain-containing protein [Pseudomonadota bacterium]
PPQEIVLQGTGVELDVSPESLNFPSSEVGDSTVMNVTITNNSAAELEVKGAVVKDASFAVNGIDKGDIIPSGGSLTFQVTSKPTEAGTFASELILYVGSEEYTVLLNGIADADFSVVDLDTNTADIDYKISLSASTTKSGQLFVIFSHDPLSAGKIYALTSNGTLKLFPYEASFGWQNLWYKNGAAPGMELDLGQVDFRPLGCTQCQGEQVDDGSGDWFFGGIIITPPNDTAFNNASDFKYMPGTLYMATYVKNAATSGVFDFNQGLLEMQTLNINSLNGTWKVISRYYDENKIHPTSLVVTEPGNGTISASWPGYNVGMSYGSNESAYVMNFNIGVYDYIYKITSLTDDTFKADYTCSVYGETIDSQPVCGVRKGSAKDMDGWICPELEIDNVIASYSGSGSVNLDPFDATESWILYWYANDSFKIVLNEYTPNDGFAEKTIVVEQPAGVNGQGVSAPAEPGTYYMEVIADGSWEIYIVKRN